jgi:hypothetical protein
MNPWGAYSILPIEAVLLAAHAGAKGSAADAAGLSATEETLWRS